MKAHLELLGALVNDHLLNRVFLHLTKRTNMSLAQLRQSHDLHDLDALFVQPNDLLVSLIKLLQGLLSCVFP